MRVMWSPGYVYRPWSDDRRAAAAAAGRRRLGIPADCAQIYGVNVPLRLEPKLRTYANYVNQKRGREAAVRFLHRALESGRIEKPSPSRRRVTERGYIYRPWPATVDRRIARLMRKPGQPSGKVVVILGISVPTEYEATLRPHVKATREKAGIEAARWIICEAWANGWPALGAPAKATDIDWDLIDALLDEHAPPDEIAAMLGISPRAFRDRMRRRP